jgi:hypothetical protein
MLFRKIVPPFVGLLNSFLFINNSKPQNPSIDGDVNK